MSSPVFLGYSGRHVRLKYQAVTASIGVLLLAFLTVEKMKIPGFIEFANSPPTWLIELGMITFSLFSIYAFYSQTQIERKHIPLTTLLFKNEIVRQKEKLVPKVDTLSGEAFNKLEKKITSSFSTIPEDITNDNNFAMYWQPTSSEFFAIQTEVEFAIIQLDAYREAIRQDIYKTNHGYDSHYYVTLQSLQKKIKEIVDLLWRPNDFIKQNGRMEFASVITSDLKLIKKMAELLPKQCDKLIADLNDHLKLRKINQEVLSVGVPLMFSIFATILGTVVITMKLLKVVT